MRISTPGHGWPTVPGCAVQSAAETRVAPPSLMPYSSQISASGKASMTAALTDGGHGRAGMDHVAQRAQVVAGPLGVPGPPAGG